MEVGDPGTAFSTPLLLFGSAPRAWLHPPSLQSYSDHSVCSQQKPLPFPSALGWTHPQWSEHYAFSILKHQSRPEEDHYSVKVSRGWARFLAGF